LLTNGVLLAVAACILIQFARKNFRKFLLYLAFFAGLGLDLWFYNSYSVYATPLIMYSLPFVPYLVYLAFTDFRKLLVSLAGLTAIAGACWLFYVLAPIIAGILIVGVVWFGLVNDSGDDLLKAAAVHSFCPSVFLER